MINAHEQIWVHSNLFRHDVLSDSESKTQRGWVYSDAKKRTEIIVHVRKDEKLIFPLKMASDYFPVDLLNQ